MIRYKATGLRGEKNRRDSQAHWGPGRSDRGWGRTLIKGSGEEKNLIIEKEKAQSPRGRNGRNDEERASNKTVIALGDKANLRVITNHWENCTVLSR